MTWLFIPSASSAGPACSTRDCEPGSPTWASRIAPSATLSGKLTQPASWSRGCKTAAWMRLLSGPTSPPSTLERSAAEWISSLPASPARISASPAGGPGLTASGRGSSSPCLTLPMLAVREGSFWRTSQASLLPPPPLWTRPKASSTSARPPESWENWPTAGAMRSGSLFQRPMWAPAMAARDGSASHGDNWLTPHGMAGQEAATGRLGAGGEFAKQATHWATPDTSRRGTEPPEQVAARRTAAGAGGLPLQTMAEHWPTPTASLTNDGEDPAQWQARADRLKLSAKNGNGAGMPLTVESAAWPTPAARDYRTPNSQESQESRTHTGGEQLVNFVEHHFSHPGLPTRPGQESSAHLPGSPQPSASKSSTPPPLSRRLNPYFVEWLMGWPMGWTSTSGRHASRHAVTALWRSKLQQRLSCLLGEPASSNKPDDMRAAA